VHERASGEIAAALTLTSTAADRELSFADTVVTRLPQVFAALSAGLIDRPKAWVFADHLEDLLAERIAAICSVLVPMAPRLTIGQLRTRLVRMIQEIDPEHARRRYQKAVRERCVVGYLGRGGTATVSASGLPATDSGTDSSRSEAAGGDTAGRGADCTDGSGSEAAGGDIGGSDTSVGETSGFRLRVGVEVRVGPATLLGLGGEIPGLGPVLPDVARTIVAAQQLAADAGSCGPGRVSWPTSRGSSPIATRSSPGSTPAPATGSSAPRSLGTSRSATVPAAIRAAAGLPASQTRTTRTTMHRRARRRGRNHSSRSTSTTSASLTPTASGSVLISQRGRGPMCPLGRLPV
jgi:hypothetical protein